MASADIFPSFGGKLLDSTSNAFNQLLLQLLLEESQDKKFVCEEAVRSLLKMVESMAPLPLLHKLRAYVTHPNPRIQAKAAVSLSKCMSKMDLNSMEVFGSVS